jgi:hypothetical protein
MKRICFLIPDGIGIRNYLYSEVISILIQQGHQVILWHSLDPELIQLTEKRLGLSFEQYPFEHKPDGMWVQLLREAARFARLKLNARAKDNQTILTNWTGKASSKKGQLLLKGAEILGSFLKSYSAVSSVEDLEFKLVRSSKSFQMAEAFLKEINPDLIFCTHQRVFSVTSAIEAANSLGILTSTAIFSWDNLPKGRLPFRTDQYLVWSNYMREELRMYYPEISENQIKVTGSPQFDFYFQNGILLDRKVIAEKYGLDASKTWVCFSGSDSLASPNDPLFLRDVAASLANDVEIQLIFRPVPVEKVDRFLPVLIDFPKVKLIKPIWVTGSHWGNFFPLFEDIQLLVNLAYHCKVVVNMGSTMALDFSTFGNIGLYLRYDHENVSAESSVKTIFEFQHFRSMGDWKAVGYIDSPSQIASMVNQAISNPDEVAPDRMLWFNKIVEPKTDKTASLQIAEALEAL